MNFTKLYARVAKFVKIRNWGEYHNPKNLAMAITCEATELLEIFTWATVAEAKEALPKKIKEAVRYEMADILIYLLSMANYLQIDLVKATNEKLDINDQRFPIGQKWQKYEFGEPKKF